jgi:hypothetical protein
VPGASQRAGCSDITADTDQIQAERQTADISDCSTDVDGIFDRGESESRGRGS